MELSKLIKDKIKEWEGCKLTAYRCPAGVLTIGYGHTGSDVTPGKKITQAQADGLFESDIRQFAMQVERQFRGVQLSACQFDALVSLAYNIGIGALVNSSLYKRVKADPSDPAIRMEFAKYVNAGGRVLPGLVKRRTFEANHYFGQI